MTTVPLESRVGPGFVRLQLSQWPREPCAASYSTIHGPSRLLLLARWIPQALQPGGSGGGAAAAAKFINGPRARLASGWRWLTSEQFLTAPVKR
jgi:hypothetical protein